MSDFGAAAQTDLGTAGCCPCEPFTPEPAPIVEEIAPAPVVEEIVSAPVLEEVAPAPVVEQPAPAPAPVVEQPAPAPALAQPAPAPLDLSQAIANQSASTGVSIDAAGSVVIGPDPSPTYTPVFTPASPTWSAEASALAAERGVGPSVPPLLVAPTAGTGSLTHPYPGFVRATDSAGHVNFYGQGYIAPVTPQTR